LAVGLIQAFSECTLDFVPLLNTLAVYFQIRDDYINLLDDNYMENKSYCEDLTEGKFSYPIILGIRGDTEDTRLISILKQRTKNVELKKYAVEYLKETGAFLRTKAKLDELVEQIHEAITKLGGNQQLEAIVQALHASLK
jgi:geranylgeranyl diphosphate synthase, type III